MTIEYDILSKFNVLSPSFLKRTMADMKAYLKNHPRMIGVLFTILLALSQAGTTTASLGNYMGP